MNRYTEERETIADPAETLQCMRIFRALRAIHQHEGPGGVELALDQARAAVNARNGELRESRDGFWNKPAIDGVRSIVGGSEATVRCAAIAVLIPTRHAVAINAIEAFALEHGISLRNGTA